MPQDLSLPSAYFAANRQALLDQLGDKALIVAVSGRAPHRTADEHYPFLANRSYFYLAGVEQEDTILLMLRDGAELRQQLFIAPPDAMHERWRGHLVSIDEAAAISGLQDIQYSDSFEGVMTDLLRRGDLRVWLDQSAGDDQAASMRQWLEQVNPQGQIEDMSPFLIQLRMIKNDWETSRIEAAASLTGRGIQAMVRRLQPGAMEYHLWSEFARTLAEEGCLSPAFASIVAAGSNVFCLHYMKPFSRIEDGDLVQIDVGAMAGGLCADISRVLPASGRFTEQQRAIYDLVRRCQETAFATIKPGATLAQVNEACRQTARNGLAALGIMQPDDAVTEYFWHNVSHHLGLDVHDVANKEAILQPGMVLTVEPGIYIPAINIGMRIEDDVLVTADGCRLLSPDIPREADEIEAMMA